MSSAASSQRAHSAEAHHRPVHIFQLYNPSQRLSSSAARPQQSASVLERLPVELISDIFLKSVEDNEDLLFLPIVIASLSRRCRAVACATKQLWTTITLTSEASDFALDRLRLQRSGMASLDIVLDFRSSHCRREYQGERAFSSASIVRRMEILLPHFTRCKTLRVHTDTWAPMSMVLAHLKDVAAAPRLITLDLLRTSVDAPYRDVKGIHPAEKFFFLSPMIPFGGNVPILKELVLVGVHTGWFYCRPLMRGLRHLNLSDHARPLRPPIGAFRDILETSKKTLRSVVISNSGPMVPDALLHSLSSLSHTRPSKSHRLSGLPPILLSEVTFLHIGYNHQLDPLCALSQFSAPNTRRLLIEDSSCALFRGRKHIDAGYTLRTIVHRFQRPNNCDTPGAGSLQSVLLNSVYARVEDFVEFFGSLPKVQEVMLNAMQPPVVEALVVILSERLQCHPPSFRNDPCAHPCRYLRSILMRGMADEVKTAGWLQKLRCVADKAGVSVGVERPLHPDDNSCPSLSLDCSPSEGSSGLARDVFETEYKDPKTGGTPKRGRLDDWIKSRWQLGARGGVDDLV